MLDTATTIVLAATTLLAGFSIFITYLFQGVSFESRYNKDDKEVEKARDALIRVLQSGNTSEQEKCNAIFHYIMAEHIRDGICCFMFFGRYVRAFKTVVQVTKYCLAVFAVVGAAFLILAPYIKDSGGGTSFMLVLLVVRLFSALVIICLFLGMYIGMTAKKLDEQRKV
jgi:hypothetical protein